MTPFLYIQTLLLILAYSPVQSSVHVDPLANKTIIIDNGIVTRSETGWSTKWSMCPTGMRATGFALKTEIYQGSTGDDTSVNGITLLCGDGKHRITSDSSRYGAWSKDVKCYDTYFITAFQSSFDPPLVNNKTSHDQIGLDNIHFLCVPPNRMLDNRVLKVEPQTKDRQSINGYRNYLTAWSNRCSTGICGINTNVDMRNKGVNIDVTGVNDVRFACC